MKKLFLSVASFFVTLIFLALSICLLASLIYAIKDTSIGLLMAAILAAMIVVALFILGKISEEQKKLTKRESKSKKNENDSYQEFEDDSDTIGFKVEGKFKIRYIDANGATTGRTISMVRVIDGNYFKAFCHLRNAERTFMFARVQHITDKDTNETTNDAMRLFEKRAEGIRGETFDNPAKTDLGTPIEGEYDFEYTNFKNGRCGTYHISNVRMNSTRIYGNIDNTDFEASIIIKKIDELVDCSTGESIRNDIRKYLKEKVEKENPSGGSRPEGKS